MCTYCYKSFVLYCLYCYKPAWLELDAQAVIGSSRPQYCVATFKEITPLIYVLLLRNYVTNIMELTNTFIQILVYNIKTVMCILMGYKTAGPSTD